MATVIRGLARCVVLCWTCIVLFFVVDIHAFNDMALRASAAQGYAGLVNAILYLGADVHADADQALGVAAQKGNTDVVELLLNRGANVHAKNDVVVFLAIQSGNSETVKVLLDGQNFTPSCSAIWLQKRSIWMKEATARGIKELTELVRDRTKPPSGTCSSAPSGSEFENWKQ